MSIRFVFAKIQINHENGKEIVLFNQFFGETTYPVARCNACKIKAPSGSPRGERLAGLKDNWFLLRGG